MLGYKHWSHGVNINSINNCYSKIWWCVRVDITPPYTAVDGLGSIVGIATDYGVDGPGIESRWGRYFPHLSTPALGPIQPPVQWILGLSRG
jgi:hypothetical protein